MLIRKEKKGFALLYALLLTGAIVAVGIILMNIITKQLFFSSLNRNSEVSYYAVANSGRECLAAAITADKFLRDPNALNFEPAQHAVVLDCLGQEITLSPVAGSPGAFAAGKASSIIFDGRKIELEVYVNQDCLNGSPACNSTSPDLKAKNSYLAIATGYSGSTGGDRTARRSAVFVMP